MLKKNKKRNNDMSIPSKNIMGIFTSNVISTAVVIVLTLIVSISLTKSASLTKSTGVVFVIIVLLGSLITGFIASKKCSYKGLISGLISSFPYIFLITFLMLVFSNGKLNIYTSVLFLLIIIFSTIGGIVSANTRRRK